MGWGFFKQHFCYYKALNFLNWLINGAFFTNALANYIFVKKRCSSLSIVNFNDYFKVDLKQKYVKLVFLTNY